MLSPEAVSGDYACPAVPPQHTTSACHVPSTRNTHTHPGAYAQSKHICNNSALPARVRTTLMRDVRTQARRMIPGYSTRGKGRDF
eukprot:369509-Prymnesium_polylepis.1